MAIKAALPNTLQVLSSKHGHRLLVGLRELFCTREETPKSDDINIATIQTCLNKLRKRHRLPELSDDELWFRFRWTGADGGDNDTDVFTDATLRYAYRIWLDGGNVDVAFVLHVVEEDLEE